MTAQEPKDGVIKFKFRLKKTAPLVQEEFIEIEKWRVILFRMGLIGEYPIEKVGYGNISKKTSSSPIEFVISGTQTGKFSNLDGSQYVKVTKCDLEKMSLEAKGPIAPSSESLTHFAIYSTCPQLGFIFHVHHKKLWEYMIDKKMESTSKDIDYGTYDMAMAAKKCIGNKTKGIFVMQGHEDGVISYGKTSEEAGQCLLEIMKEINN